MENGNVHIWNSMRLVKKYKKVGYPLTTHPRNTPNDHGLQITKTTNRPVIWFEAIHIVKVTNHILGHVNVDQK